ncbi:MAG: hypothetical protein HYV65_02340 [Candidatus Spechtbacteria bacterium]|nr:hypothetical protein [Candidatus Spechtbacteria bacterium]
MKSTIRTAISIVIFAAAFYPADYLHAQTDTTFFVDSSYEEDGKTQEKARFLLGSSQTYIYVEDEYFRALASEQQDLFTIRAQKIAQEFDQITYPRLRAVFGREWNTGIDNDARVTIYFTRMKARAEGYIRKNDEYGKSFFDDSNEREMLYVSATSVLNSSQAGAILAHEFQHLITLNQKTKLQGVQEERWLDEAKSEYAVTAAGFNDAWEGSRLQESVRLLRLNPNDALLVWEDEPIDYATASLFLHYLVGQYGEVFLKQLNSSRYVGAEAITQALASLGKTRTFSDVFEDWTVALLINRDIDGTGRYAYSQPMLQYNNLHIQPPVTHTISSQTPAVGSNSAFQDFQPQWYRFIPSLLEGKKVEVLEISLRTHIDNDYVRVPVITTLLTGETRISYSETREGKMTVRVSDFMDDVSSVVIIPASHTEIRGREKLGVYRILAISVNLTDVQPPAVSPRVIRDGDLIRAKGTTKVYVVNGFYRRWIQSPQIMAMYGHLRWENIVEVTEEELQRYKESFLIQKAGDFRIYEVTLAGSGTKQWLNMTPQRFEASGRAWSAVFTVNAREFVWYKTGNILRI